MNLKDEAYILSALNVFSDREHGNEHFLSGIETAREIVKDAPAIEPKPQWIPVTERLPETSQDVLITRRSARGTVRAMKAFYMQSDDGGIWASQCGIDTTGVIAWLPLPELYTADAEENEGVQPAHWEKADIPLPYQIRTVPTPSGTFAHREVYVCSACGEYSEQNTRYCPHCGAKMDKEDTE